MCWPHRVWPLRSEPVGEEYLRKWCALNSMKMCCLGGKNSVVKGLRSSVLVLTTQKSFPSLFYTSISASCIRNLHGLPTENTHPDY